MTTLIVLTATSLGLAGLYFLLSSGLSLIFGLMDVLNVAHAAIFGVGGYAAWIVMDRLTLIEALPARFAVALVVAVIFGCALGYVVERTLIARNYGDHLTQILITLGLAFVIEGLIGGIFSYSPRTIAQPAWFADITMILGGRIPNSRILIFGISALVLVSLLFFMKKSKYGLIIRAGVENRQMVQALGIDVARSFTFVFVLGAALACLGGALGAVYFTGITPALGPNLLIFAFIVVIIGGLGSIGGTAIAAALVAFTQQIVNFYVSTGLGDIAVVGLLAAVLLLRPQGLLGRVASA
ncbi:branched-chain amino acid ABC transporter permease [Rhodococcus opacus]|jgi:branched-chain amino acid transport system permease protein|uniref:branched-chain amino acid ABC transporter permease n=1 Tax=Rhodococcus opacus TaxID=37919 RepID=UPI000EA9A6E9|nr:branched-chain amino acid ABC transporter permease [Rhodococcus opacus]QZS52717.1 branched-chain amino acid ABC transporter permease [Rhodococcus opacus]RKM65286.1 branched-chain amino acid ABC transporter permease [Rhodococcus opacus]